MKKVLSVVMVLAMVLSFAGLLSAYADNAVQQLWVRVGGEDVDSAKSDKAVSWWQAENGEYFFFIPSYWDASALKVFPSVEGEVKLNGNRIVSGEAYDLGKSGTFTSAEPSAALTIRASMLSGLRSEMTAKPNAGGGSGVFSRSRKCVISAISSTGKRQSVKSSAS